MKVYICRPNYIPHLSFFYKVEQADIFVSLDTVPFTKNGFQNRNKIRTPQGEQWLTVPVKTKGKNGQLTNQVEIDNSSNWADKHWKAIKQNYSKAPYWHLFSNYFKTIYNFKWDYLVQLNGAFLQYLFMEFELDHVELFKASNLFIEGSNSELLVSICKAVGGTVYVSGPSGRDYLNEELFEKAGIVIEYFDFKQRPYKQIGDGFIPNLSAIDYLFNCGSEL